MVSELIVPTKKDIDFLTVKYGIKEIYILFYSMILKKFDKNKYINDVYKLKESIGLNKNDFILLLVSRISSEKNIEFIIKNHNVINKKYKNIKLVIVGDGPILEDLIKKNKNENIIFLGKVPWDQIPLYYQLWRYFLLQHLKLKHKD